MCQSSRHCRCLFVATAAGAADLPPPRLQRCFHSTPCPVHFPLCSTFSWTARACQHQCRACFATSANRSLAQCRPPVAAAVPAPTSRSGASTTHPSLRRLLSTGRPPRATSPLSKQLGGGARCLRAVGQWRRPASSVAGARAANARSLRHPAASSRCSIATAGCAAG